MGERRKRPGKGEGEVKLVRRVVFVAEPDDRVLEAQKDARVDVEGEVQVDRSSAALFWVKVDLPHLSE